jgi:hypothetical protein
LPALWLHFRRTGSVQFFRTLSLPYIAEADLRGSKAADRAGKSTR